MTPTRGRLRPPVPVMTQPLRSIAWPVVLCSSIHSSAVLAAVPPQATSLITTAKSGNAVGVEVGVEVGVGVSVGEGSVEVGVGVGVEVGVGGKTPLELGCLGVPLRGALLASCPFRMTVSLLCQFVSVSGTKGSILSILR